MGLELKYLRWPTSVAIINVLFVSLFLLKPQMPFNSQVLNRIRNI